MREWGVDRNLVIGSAAEDCRCSYCGEFEVG
jgi:hypothetical protein